MDSFDATLPLSRAALVAAAIADGTRLSGRYRIVRLLGSGGMGRVYEAVDEELGIGVALKTLRPDAAAEPESLRALKREVLLARLVTHPNVCRVHDLGNANDTWFITMELLRGETLGDRLQHLGPLTPDQAIQYARPIIEGLVAAHRAGVVHRDFKPDNAMIVGTSGSERVVVTDFGIARSIAVPAGEEAMAGTPSYMAPEQVRGEEAGPAADIYALGVVLFEMVTGRLPYEGGTPLEIATRRLFEPAPSARAFAPDLDTHWERAIARCLSLAPEDRFASAAAVALALEGIDEAPSIARPALPAELNAFFGRESELDELERQLENGAGLVSLLGPGGMGKTRLAIHFGRRSLPRWTGGVWFCDVSEATTRDGVLAAVASALGLSLGRSDAAAQLGVAIAGRGECLVILDNLEQVTSEAAPLIAAWMEHAPQARFLVTSRERLQITGERPLSIAHLSEDQALTLFIERAQRHRPGLAFEGDDLVTVRQLIALLDGMPLAIELAAARLRVLSAGQVLARMNERFRLLSGGRGRHATLATTLDVSWELLDPWERAAWAEVSVFQGGFTLEAAEQVIDLAPWPQAPWVVDVMQSLVDKSILRVGTIEDGATERPIRFGMYVSLQEYASAKLASAEAIPGATGGDAVHAAQRRHGHWFAAFGTSDALRQAEGVAAGGWNRFVPELENLVAASRRALARRELAIAAACYLAAAVVIDRVGPFSRAIELGREVLEAALAPADRLRVLLQIARFEWRSGRHADADAHFAEGMELARELDDRGAEATALIGQGHVRRETGRVAEAKEFHEMALARAKSAGDSRAQTTALMALGIATGELGDLPTSTRCFEEGLALARSDGNRRMELFLRTNLGITAQRLGDDDGELEHFEAVVSMAREFGDRRLLGIGFNNLASTRFKKAQYEEAIRLRERALEEVREIGDRRTEGEILGMMGATYSRIGANEKALDCFQRAVAIPHELGDHRKEADELSGLAKVLMALGRMDEAEQALGRAENLLGRISDPLIRVKHLAARAVFEFHRGDVDAAHATLATADAIAEKYGSVEVSQIVATAREAIKAL